MSDVHDTDTDPAATAEATGAFARADRRVDRPRGFGTEHVCTNVKHIDRERRQRRESSGNRGKPSAEPTSVRNVQSSIQTAGAAPKEDRND